MVGLAGKDEDEVECEVIDWDEDVSEVPPVKEQEAGRAKLLIAETPWCVIHGPHTGPIEKCDGGITEEREHIPTNLNAEELATNPQRVLRSHVRKYTAKLSDDTKEKGRQKRIARHEQGLIVKAVKYFQSRLWCRQCNLQRAI